MKSLKEIIKFTLRDAKKEAKELTDANLNALLTKVTKINALLNEESNRRYIQKVEDDMDEKLEAEITEDEVQSDEEEA